VIVLTSRERGGDQQLAFKRRESGFVPGKGASPQSGTRIWGGTEVRTMDGLTRPLTEERKRRRRRPSAPALQKKNAQDILFQGKKESENGRVNSGERAEVGEMLELSDTVKRKRRNNKKRIGRKRRRDEGRTARSERKASRCSRRK